MFDVKLFKLLERLEPGQSAKARLMQWNGERYIAEAATVRVHDHLGHYGWAGDRGHCFKSPCSGQWEVLNGLSAQAQQLTM